MDKLQPLLSFNRELFSPSPLDDRKTKNAAEGIDVDRPGLRVYGGREAKMRIGAMTSWSVFERILAEFEASKD